MTHATFSVFKSSLADNQAMKILFALALACTNALSIRDATATDAAVEQPPKSLVGFLYDGFDFGDLWLGLSDA